MKMNSKKLVFYIVVFFICFGFYLRYKKNHVVFIGIPYGNNPSKNVGVRLILRREPKSVGAGYAFDLIIENKSEHDLLDCILIFNKKYRVELKELEVYRGLMKDNVKLGVNILLKKSFLKLKFHHDNNNFLPFDIMLYKSLQKGNPPKYVSLKTSIGNYRWKLQEKK